LNEVLSFVEKNTEQELTYEVVEVGENNEIFQAVKVFYPNPIPEVGTLPLN